MKLFLSFLVVFSWATSASEFERRQQAAEQANQAHWDQLYHTRSRELEAKISRKIQKMCAPQGGCDQPSFRDNGVAGSTYLALISFNADNGRLACQIDPMFGYDFEACKGDELTKCPDFKIWAKCYDRSKREFSMSANGVLKAW